MDILVRQNFTEADAKKARLDAAEFRKSKATSEVSSLLSFIDLKKSVILCDSHVRKFNAAAHHYKAHPEFSRVIGNCDVCQQRVLGRFFVHEQEWITLRKAQEKFKRSLEYAAIASQ